MSGSEKDELWHRRAVSGGERWADGAAHFGFLRALGLKRSHTFLDLGCGSLRSGVHLIRFLDKGRYFGLDKEKQLVRKAVEYEVKASKKLTGKMPVIGVSGEFDIDSIAAGVKFDRVWAYSLFTHLTPQQIEVCILEVMPRLRQGKNSVFYASYNNSSDVEIGEKHGWRDEIAVARYPYTFFEGFASKHGFTVSRVCGPIVSMYSDDNKQNILAFRNG